MTKKFSKVNKQRKTKRNRNKGKNKTRVLYRGGEVDMKFILLHEFNTKENESFIYFMQYTGNEETIASFSEFISKADYDAMGGDYVKFEIDTENLVSKNTAVEMEKCNFGMFSILDGTMVDPFHGDSVKDMEGDEIARRLNDEFYGYGNTITKLFVKPGQKNKKKLKIE
jgi:hypothetical protein